MAVLVVCECGEEIRVRDELSGKKIRCGIAVQPFWFRRWRSPFGGVDRCCPAEAETVQTQIRAGSHAACANFVVAVAGIILAAVLMTRDRVIESVETEFQKGSLRYPVAG